MALRPLLRSHHEIHNYFGISGIPFDFSNVSTPLGTGAPDVVVPVSRVVSRVSEFPDAEVSDEIVLGHASTVFRQDEAFDSEKRERGGFAVVDDGARDGQVLQVKFQPRVKSELFILFVNFLFGHGSGTREIWVRDEVPISGMTGLSDVFYFFFARITPR